MTTPDLRDPGQPWEELARIRRQLDAVFAAARAIIDDASPCQSSGERMVSVALLRELEQAISDAKWE